MWGVILESYPALPPAPVARADIINVVGFTMICYTKIRYEVCGIDRGSGGNLKVEGQKII